MMPHRMPMLVVLAILAAMLCPVRADAPRPGENIRGQYRSGAVPAQVGGQVAAGRIEDTSRLPGGLWSLAATGDYYLENQSLRLILRGEERERVGRDVPGAGALVDFAFREENWDRFGGVQQMVFHGGGYLNVRYDEVTPKGGQTPSVEALGTVEGLEQVEVLTRYTLDADKPLGRIYSEFRNTGDEPVELILMDMVSWGGMPVFIGGYGVPDYTQNVARYAHWVCGFEPDFALGLINESVHPMAIISQQANHSLVRHGERFPLSPGGSVHVSRVLVATYGDMGPIEAYASTRKGFPQGVVRGRLLEEGSERPVPGAEIRLNAVNKDNPKDSVFHPYLLSRTDGEGRFELLLPEGEFYAQSITPGRPLLPSSTVSFYIYRDDPYQMKPIRTTPPNLVRFVVRDFDSKQPMPAQLRIEPREGALGYSLGPPERAESAHLLVNLGPGPVEVPLSAGSYRCHFSRGPEYELFSETIDIRWGENRSYEIELRRVLDSSGAVSVELDLDSDRSRGSRVAPRDLVRAAASRGVEWVVSGDENTVTDLEAAIRAEGLQDWIKASRGARLSYRHEKLYGDFYLFPLPETVTDEALAALAGPDTSPAEFFSNAHALGPDVLVCLRNILEPNASYLRYYQFDPETMATPHGEFFSADFDALIPSGGKERGRFMREHLVSAQFFQAGHPALPLASSDPADLYHQPPGAWRIYLNGGKDDARQLDDADLVRLLRERRYFITNGPYIEQSLIDEPQIRDAVFNGQYQMGNFSIRLDPQTSFPLYTPENQGRARFAPRGGHFLHAVRVQAAPWVSVTGMRVRDFGERNSRWTRMASSESRIRYPSDPQKAPYRWSLNRRDPDTGEVEHFDTYYHVEVLGESLWPWASGERDDTFNSLAITPPCALDAQGDGEQDYGYFTGGE